MASMGSLWKRLLGVEQVVLKDWFIDEAKQCFVVRVRARKNGRHCFSICERRCPGYDRGGGPRRWRGLDLGTMRVFLEAEPVRVRCKEHGVLAAAVPWARPRSSFTRAFEDQVAWLAVRMSRTAVAELMRAAWRTVEAILERVGDEARRRVDLLGGLRRIGIDELSHRKGQKYITVVVDHATGRLVWAAPDRDQHPRRPSDVGQRGDRGDGHQRAQHVGLVRRGPGERPGRSHQNLRPIDRLQA